jgi:hypothetical protein
MDLKKEGAVASTTAPQNLYDDNDDLVNRPEYTATTLAGAQQLFVVDDLTERVDRGPCESDRIFFRQHPKRKFRLRPAWDVELEDFSRASDGKCGYVLPDPLIWWIIVYQAKPGVRFRTPIFAPHTMPTEVSERDARAVWRGLPAGMKERQRQMTKTWGR